MDRKVRITAIYLFLTITSNIGYRKANCASPIGQPCQAKDQEADHRNGPE